MRILDAIAPPPKGQVPAPSNHAGNWDTFRRNGIDYLAGTLAGSSPSRADGTFASMVQTIHNENGIVSGCVAARMLLLSEVHFAWRESKLGEPGDLSHTKQLDALLRPGTISKEELLMRLELDASYAGNAYVVRRRGVTYRLDPSRVTFMFGSNSEPGWSADDNMLLPFDARVVALGYANSDEPGSNNVEIFYPGEFAHWKPEPDPVHWWRGQSWITSLMRNVVPLDGQIMDHQSKYFENAATPNVVLLMDPTKSPDEVGAYAKVFNEKFSGSGNAYKNWFLGGGTDVKVVGQELSTMTMKDLTGGLETRVAMRARVPAVIAGVREGLSGSSLNSGNYAAARRLFADGWFTPSVKSLCGALEALVPAPHGRQLSHDPSKVLFLQEDRKDEAEIDGQKVASIRQLIDTGFDPVTAVQTIAPGWAGKLEHTGRVSVQLRPPGSGDESGATDADARSVMGRLGRVDNVADVDPVRIVDGLSAQSARIVSSVLAQHQDDDVKTLRKQMLAAFQKEKANV